MHLEICKLRALRPSFLQFRGTIRTLAKPFELSPFYRMAVRVRNLSRSREHSSSLGRGGRGIGCGVPIKDLDFLRGSRGTWDSRRCRRRGRAGGSTRWRWPVQRSRWKRARDWAAALRHQHGYRVDDSMHLLVRSALSLQLSGHCRGLWGRQAQQWVEPGWEARLQADQRFQSHHLRSRELGLQTP